MMNRAIIKTSQTISDIFSPLLIPTYCMAIAMWVTPLQALPERNRLIATFGVLLITGLIPFALIALLIKLGKISDRSISDRSQRLVPMITAVICYLAAAAYVRIIGGPLWLSLFFIGATVSSITALIITRWWKISAHSTAVGGMVGMMAWFGLAGLANVDTMIWLSAVILLAGATSTARLILNRHTLAQVTAGFFLGCIAELVTMNITIDI